MDVAVAAAATARSRMEFFYTLLLFLGDDTLLLRERGGSGTGEAEDVFFLVSREEREES